MYLQHCKVDVQSSMYVIMQSTTETHLQPTSLISIPLRTEQLKFLIYQLREGKKEEEKKKKKWNQSIGQLDFTIAMVMMN